jgi:tetratricopeptide (TPR) repeat protein
MVAPMPRPLWLVLLVCCAAAALLGWRRTVARRRAERGTKSDRGTQAASSPPPSSRRPAGAAPLIHPDEGAQSLAEMADVLLHQGKPEQALELLDKAAVIRGQLLGVDAPAFAALLPLFAWALCQLRRFSIAEALLRKLLGDRAGPLPAPPAVVKEGEPLFGSRPEWRALESDRLLKQYLTDPSPAGKLGPEVEVAALHRLGETFAAQGRPAEASLLLREALAAAEANEPGPDRPRCAEIQKSLGDVLAALDPKPARH